MPEKTFSCTITVVMTTGLKILGVACGVLLLILGIVALAGDTRNVWYNRLYEYYTPETFTITAGETTGLSNNNIWVRPQEKLRFRWNLLVARRLRECTALWVVLPDGFVSDDARQTEGDYTLKIKSLTITDHYYCITSAADDGICDPLFLGTIHVYKNTIFYGRNHLGNQNMRFAFIILCIVLVLFGIVIALGELHMELITSKFTFFYFSFMKGVVYLMTGVICLGICGFLGLVVAIVFFICALINMWQGRNQFIHFKWNEVRQRGTTTIVTHREYI